MITVYKYPLEVKKQILALPEGAEFLQVSCEENTVMIWFRVDTKASNQSRLFRMVGTGQPMDSNTLVYLGTTEICKDLFTIHLFEETNEGKLEEYI